MLNAQDVHDINADILRTCLLAHATRNFSGDLVFIRTGEAVTWKRTEVHTERPPADDWSRAMQEHWPSITPWLLRNDVALEVSFRSGKITRTLIRTA